jgi:Uma2 family endonuclease
MATAPAKLWTIDDLDDLPDGRVEVWRGELVDLPASGTESSAIGYVIGSAILQFARPKQLGTVTGEAGGYILSRAPFTLLIPDVAFVRSSTMPEVTPRIPEVAPDLVVEVVSPTDRMSEVDEKVAVYLASGVSIVWVVLPRRKVVVVHSAAEPGVTRAFGVGDELDGGAVQGIGQALCENFVYDAQSGQVLTGTFMDYALPRSSIIADFRTTMDESTPCLNNAMGVKGVGELGTIGATPAVVNAVIDALARAGAADAASALQMPLTSERVWQALRPRAG